MPPPGIPDWVFPGAILRRQDGQARWVITSLHRQTPYDNGTLNPVIVRIEIIVSSLRDPNRHYHLQGPFQFLSIGRLLASGWLWAGTWLPDIQPEPLAEPGPAGPVAWDRLDRLP